MNELASMGLSGELGGSGVAPGGRGRNCRKVGLDGFGKGLPLFIIPGGPSRARGPFPMHSLLSSLWALVSPQAPILGHAQRRTLLAPIGFSWQGPPWSMFLLDEDSL